MPIMRLSVHIGDHQTTLLDEFSIVGSQLDNINEAVASVRRKRASIPGRSEVTGGDYAIAEEITLQSTRHR